MISPNPTIARDRSFVRKVIYLVLMGALLMPLFWLSHPATRDLKEAKGRPGGKLSQLREEYHLNETELGQIDPTSETIRLATLGMRGVAGGILWSKANKYQMKKDWTNLRAVLEQISKLQPHSIGVWRYQAWNLSYNVSVSFDDYHDKYYWIIEGIKFLQRGAQYNEHEPRLVWDVGWFIAHKIGRADEAKLFRRLFKEDDQFHGSRPAGDSRDNWLVGKEWFKIAEGRIDDQHPVRGMSDVIFYSDAPMCQFYFGEALEKDGRFEEVALRAWKKATDDWYEFGERDMPTSYEVTLRLNDQERHEEAARRAAAALDKVAPGVRDKIEKEKRAKLAPRQLKALETPLDKRTPEQLTLAAEAGPALQILHEEVARRVTGPQRRQAMKLAEEASHNEEMALYVRRERSKVNFDYWRLRAQVEQTQEALDARKAVFQGDQAYRRADLSAALAAYERGLQGWRKVLDRFPTLKDDLNTGEDLVEVIKRYARCLGQDDKQLPKPFILQDILDKHGKRQ